MTIKIKGFLEALASQVEAFDSDKGDGFFFCRTYLNNTKGGMFSELLKPTNSWGLAMLIENVLQMSLDSLADYEDLPVTQKLRKKIEECRKIIGIADLITRKGETSPDEEWR